VTTATCTCHELGLSIAFPTRTVYFEGDNAKTLAGGVLESPDE
jgi:hypothetical protein